MKHIIFSIALLFAITNLANAQNADTKIIAMITKASWCPVCKANGPRFEKDIMPMIMQDKDVLMVIDDVSDDNTKAASKEMLEKAGVYKFAEENNATGVLYFFDAKTKKLISSISLAKSNEEIKKTYQDALSKV